MGLAKSAAREIYTSTRLSFFALAGIGRRRKSQFPPTLTSKKRRGDALLKYDLARGVLRVGDLMMGRPLPILQALRFHVKFAVGLDFTGPANLGYSVGIAANLLAGHEMPVLD